ncbi:MAG: hypothetical protein IJ958_10675 [Agathobacter sp.]|nr:hypothetical protein [Agathobacter sp.]
MFLNCSNHKSENWTKEQLDAVMDLGESVIEDYAFPNVPADADENHLLKLAERVCDEIMEKKPGVVMCQGEFTLTHKLVNELLKNGVCVVAACTERVTSERVMPDGTVKKDSIYKFVRFRKYIQ